MTARPLPWFRVDATLPDHPKVRRLERALGDLGALSYVIRLWAWASKYSSDGDLSAFDVAEIEEECHWLGEPHRLMAALIDVGFIDDGKHGVRIHGWSERQSEASRKRSDGAARARKFRLSRSAEKARNESNAETVTPVTPLRNAATVTPTDVRTDERTTERVQARGRAGEAPARPAGDPPAPDPLPYLDALRSHHPRFGLELEVARALQESRALLPSLEVFTSSLIEHAACDEWRAGYAPGAAKWVRGAGWRSPAPPPRQQTDSRRNPHPLTQEDEEFFARAEARAAAGEVVILGRDRSRGDA